MTLGLELTGVSSFASLRSSHTKLSYAASDLLSLLPNVCVLLCVRVPALPCPAQGLIHLWPFTTASIQEPTVEMLGIEAGTFSCQARALPLSHVQIAFAHSTSFCFAGYADRMVLAQFRRRFQILAQPVMKKYTSAYEMTDESKVGGCCTGHPWGWIGWDQPAAEVAFSNSETSC